MDTPQIQNKTQTGTPIEFEAPCCYSVRECTVRALYIISLTSKKVLREIEAVRCARGYQKKFKFYPADNVVLVHYYRSNRGNVSINVIWMPEGVPKEQVEYAVKKALGLLSEYNVWVSFENAIVQKVE